MGQGFGNPAGSSENDAVPPYDRYGGMEALTPTLLLMQTWLAIADGARGIFLYFSRRSGRNKIRTGVRARAGEHYPRLELAAD